MNGKLGTAVLEGAITAVVLSERDYRLRNNADTRLALRQGQDASGAAQSALTALDSLVNSGDIIRIGVDTVSDFLAGLSLGGNQEDAPPSATPSSTPLLARPIVTEAMAVAPQQWPPAANEYDANGKIKTGTAWLLGQNALTGLLMGFAEIRAALGGLAQPSHPSSFVLAQYYRATQGLASAVAAGAALTVPLTQAQYDAAWAKMFGLTSTSGAVYPSGLVSSQIVDGSPVANSTTEGELAEIVWPAGLLANPGECATFLFGGTIAGNATLTGRLRLDNGTILAQLAIAVASTTVTRQQRLTVTRRADVGGLEVYECASDNSDSPVTDLVSFAPGAVHKIVWTGTWAAAAVGNIATAKTAILDKL